MQSTTPDVGIHITYPQGEQATKALEQSKDNPWGRGNVEEAMRTSNTLPSSRNGGKEKEEESEGQLGGTEKETDRREDSKSGKKGGRVWKPVVPGRVKSGRQRTMSDSDSKDRRAGWKKRKKQYIPKVGRNDLVAQQLHIERLRLAGESDAVRELQEEGSHLGEGREGDLLQAEYRERVSSRTLLECLRDEGLTSRDIIKGDYDVNAITRAFHERQDELRNRIVENPTEHIKQRMTGTAQLDFEFSVKTDFDTTYVPWIVLITGLIIAFYNHHIYHRDVEIYLNPFFYFVFTIFLLVTCIMGVCGRFIWLGKHMYPKRMKHSVSFVRLLPAVETMSKDQRAEAIALGKMKYLDPLLAEFEYLRQSKFSFKKRKAKARTRLMVVSLEVISQIAHAANIRMGMSDHDIYLRLQRAAETLNVVNLDRYGYLDSSAVVVDSIMVAYSYYKDLKRRIKKSRFPFPAPPV